MIYDKNTPEIVFNYLERKYVLCSLPNLRKAAPPGASLESRRQISSSPYHDVNYFCRLLQSAKTSELRQLLNDGSHNVNSIDEKQVHIRVAALLQSGRIVLFELVKTKAVVKSSSGQSVEAYEYIDINQIQSSADIAINRPPTPKVVTNDEPGVDEQAQIAVLIAAAKSGVPFCEMCAKQEEA